MSAESLKMILPDGHKNIRKIDASQQASALKKSEDPKDNVSKAYAPILRAAVDLVKAYQTATNDNSDLRSLRLADLILDRHVALLDKLLKDADTWKTVKTYFESKVTSELNKSSKATSSKSGSDKSVCLDPSKVISDLNDAITAALKKYASSKAADDASDDTHTADSKSSTASKVRKIRSAKVESKLHSKAYTKFIHGLKKDFEDFIEEYDKRKQVQLDNKMPIALKAALPIKKTGILPKPLNITSRNSVLSKLKSPLRSFRKSPGIDFKAMSKLISTSILSFTVKSASAMRRALSSRKTLGKARAIIIGTVLATLGVVGKILGPLLNLFAKGPLTAVFNIILLPIKLVIGAIAAVVKPILKIVTGLAKVILAPIKFLVMQPIKLIKSIGSFVNKSLGKILDFLHTNTFKKMLLAFLKSGGAFAIGYIIGLIWFKWIQPTYNKVVQFMENLPTYIEKIKTFMVGDKNNESFFSKLFSRERKFEPGTFPDKINRIINIAYSVFDWIATTFGGSLSNAGSFFSNIFEKIVDTIPFLKMMFEFVTSKGFITAMKIHAFLHRSLTGPIAKAFRHTTGITKLVGIGLSAAMEGIRKMFKFFSLEKDEKLTIDNAYTRIDGKSKEKLETFGMNKDGLESYYRLKTGVEGENSDVKVLADDLNKILKVSNDTNGNFTEFPEFINKVIVSYMLGNDNPETFDIPSNFASLKPSAQFEVLREILSARKTRAEKFGQILESGNRDQVVLLINTYLNDKNAFKMTFEYSKDSKGKTVTAVRNNSAKTLSELSSMESSTNIGMMNGKNGFKIPSDGRKTLRVNKGELSMSQRKAMEEAGMLDEDWFEFEDKYTIDLSPEKVQKYQKIYMERRMKNLDLSPYSNYGRTVELRERIEKAMKDYFKVNDLASLSDADIRRDFREIAKNIVEGKEYSIKHDYAVKEKMKGVSDNIDAATEEAKSIDNGQNTVVVNEDSQSKNPAEIEAQKANGG